MQQPPAIEDVFTFREFCIPVPNQRPRNCFRVSLFALESHSPKIAPCPTSQIIARVIAKQSAAARRPYGHRFPGEGIASGFVFFAGKNIPWRDYTFVFVSFTEARIPTPPLLHDPPNQAIKNHQKSSHQLIVFVLLRMLEEMLDDRLMTTAIQRLRQVTENLPPRPRTGILFPA